MVDFNVVSLPEAEATDVPVPTGRISQFTINILFAGGMMPQMSSLAVLALLGSKKNHQLVIYLFIYLAAKT